MAPSGSEIAQINEIHNNVKNMTLMISISFADSANKTSILNIIID